MLKTLHGSVMVHGSAKECAVGTMWVREVHDGARGAQEAACCSDKVHVGVQEALHVWGWCKGVCKRHQVSWEECARG